MIFLPRKRDYDIVFPVENACSADACTRPTIARGMCTKHYQRWAKHGTTTLPPKRRKVLDFIEAAIANDTDECILWPYGSGLGGYGVAKYNGKTTSAHRIALILAAGEPLTPDLVAAHDPVKCTSRLCINPRHLRWASHAENTEDKFISGTVARGEKASTSGLTEKDVLDIFRSTKPADHLAPKYKVHPQTIMRIRSGYTWSWLTGAAGI